MNSSDINLTDVVAKIRIYEVHGVVGGAHYDYVRICSIEMGVCLTHGKVELFYDEKYQNFGVK